jgi:hypothetical protein
MDELGLAVQHSESPNSVSYPFLFSINNQIDQNLIAYNLLIIKQPLLPGHFVTRDFLAGINDPLAKSARLLKQTP